MLIVNAVNKSGMRWPTAPRGMRKQGEERREVNQKCFACL